MKFYSCKFSFLTCTRYDIECILVHFCSRRRHFILSRSRVISCCCCGGRGCPYELSKAAQKLKASFHKNLWFTFQQKTEVRISTNSLWPHAHVTSANVFLSSSLVSYVTSSCLSEEWSRASGGVAQRVLVCIADLWKSNFNFLQSSPWPHAHAI